MNNAMAPALACKVLADTECCLAEEEWEVALGGSAYSWGMFKQGLLNGGEDMPDAFTGMSRVVFGLSVFELHFYVSFRAV